jgi:putative restriction endonuclease
LHQARFRALVLPAYRERCTVCRLRETRLLDAAHIARDVDPRGAPVITNGLSLCSIHHRAFDEDLVGISPDYRVHVAARLLDDEDGPMLDLLKGFEGSEIELPRRAASRPDRELLEERFERFRSVVA